MSVIGIDLGGTQMRGCQVWKKDMGKIFIEKVPNKESEEEILKVLFRLIDEIIDQHVKAVGIGVPSLVDVERGIVYDVQNIPSWREVFLKDLLEERYKVPVMINNDSNCFALGEKFFGQGQEVSSFIGLTLGTGIGAGIILNNKLYVGANCGAGEIGMLEYLDYNYEHYASGQFFKYIYDMRGERVYERAERGESEYLKIWEIFGKHLGRAIKALLYMYDPEMIVLGGSISKAYAFFESKMWEEINTFAYPNSLKKFKIKISNLKQSGILGAAALCYD